MADTSSSSISYGASDVANATSELISQIADGQTKKNQYLALIEEAKANRVKAASERAQAEWDKVIAYNQEQADYYQQIIDCYTQMINNNGTASATIIEQQANAQKEAEEKKAQQKKRKILIISAIGLGAVALATLAVVIISNRNGK